MLPMRQNPVLPGLMQLELRPMAQQVDITKDTPPAALTPVQQPAMTPAIGVEPMRAALDAALPAALPVQRPGTGPEPADYVASAKPAPETDDWVPGNSSAGETNADLLQRRLGVHTSQRYLEADTLGEKANELNDTYLGMVYRRQSGQYLGGSGAPVSTGVSSGAFKGGTPWDNMFIEAGRKYNINPAILAGIAEKESSFRNTGANSAGAVGIMQVINGSLDPRTNIDQGAAELARYLYDPRYKWANGDLNRALWSYNAGYTGAQKGYKTGYGGKYQQVVMDAAKRWGWGGADLAFGAGANPNAVGADPGGTIRGGTYGTDSRGNQGNTHAAMDFIKNTWGIDSYKDGYASSGHVNNSDHYKGLAIDVDVPGNDGDRKADDPLGIAVRDWFFNSVSHGNPFGVRQIIYNNKIWTLGDPRGWHDYHGPNNHAGHVHVGFANTGGKVGPYSGGGAVGTVPYVDTGPSADEVAAGEAANQGRAAYEAAQAAAQEAERRAQLLSRLGGMRLFSGEWS